ncbi:MAG TPA: hypothetical protein VMJ10_12020 [Kofleriaceae bacterium]|nr:hypothetical protein [Kofleriaceae bacterium]
MKIFVMAAFVLVPTLAHADPRVIRIETTISDGAKTLSSPTLLVLEGAPATFKTTGGDTTLELGFTARLQSGQVALDIRYDEKTRQGVGTWTTRSLSTHAVVKDCEPITIAMSDRHLVITPRTRTAAGSDRCSRAGA